MGKQMAESLLERGQNVIATDLNDNGLSECVQEWSKVSFKKWNFPNLI